MVASHCDSVEMGESSVAPTGTCPGKAGRWASAVGRGRGPLLRLVRLEGEARTVKSEWRTQGKKQWGHGAPRPHGQPESGSQRRTLPCKVQGVMFLKMKNKLQPALIFRGRAGRAVVAQKRAERVAYLSDNKHVNPQHGAERQKSKDVKMQERSHHVIENKGSGLGSFVKTNAKRSHSRGRANPFWMPTGGPSQTRQSEV